jgi:NTP pyrophosphatase (non-canonical NTP hydrolase)
MTYYLYHIPGKKIGVTRDLKYRVEEQQGYLPGEYEVIYETEDIDEISANELSMQRALGYRVDMKPYNKLKCNNMKMNINITEQTTTFPCPVNKLKGQLMDNIGMHWETDHGDCKLTDKSIKWIMRNVKESMYNTERCYIYNKAFSRWFDNNDPYHSHDKLGGNLEDPHMRDQYAGKCRSGALAPTGIQERRPDCDCISHFDLIRDWAQVRGLYDNGDPKTQALKLVEEVGETCRAVLKEDKPEILDGIGDCVVVLTNLAELVGVPIEDCIQMAYDEISKRKGKMINGTFVKND